MNDILKSINLRLNNPFILSFCISWIFWNWPITVGLLWYNSQSLPQYGYANYSELIIGNSDIFKNFVGPLIFAMAYPFLKWGFNLMQTWVSSKEEKTIKVVSGKGYIPTSKYLNVLEKYDLDVKKLSQIIEDESKTIEENANLRTSLAEKNVSIAEYQKDVQISRKYSENIFLEGKWEVTIKGESGDTVFKEIVSFDRQGKAYKSSRRKKDVIDYVPLNIIFFSYNAIINRGLLIIKNPDGDMDFTFTNCKFDDTFSILEDSKKELNSLSITIGKYSDND